jgi:hypothetical protein
MQKGARPAHGPLWRLPNIYGHLFADAEANQALVAAAEREILIE